MNTVYLIDLLAVFVFALSGALAADRQRMDLFGFVGIALLPALGGGTLRDLIIDAPVFWLSDTVYLLMVLLAALFTFLAANLIHRTGQWLAWADAVGLALFSVIGASKTLALGHGPVIATVMGVITAVAGGMLRDVTCNEVPLILREEVYATAALAGAATCVGLTEAGAPPEAALWIGALIGFAVRGAGLIWHLSLPKRGVPPAD
ncbi:MAG TPA: trimeric intracellular cation channel family protein [Pseudomonadales bacterium]